MAQNTLKIALAQLNPTVGDVAGNEQKARAARAEAARMGADLVMFTEQFLAAYPAEDLVLKPAFQDVCRAAIERLARETADGGPGMLIGLPWREGDELYNAYALLDGGTITVRYKVDLPNYDVFDEKRNFDAGPLPGPVNFRGIRIGVPICEDIWTGDVVECLAETGAEILLVPNGSPYHRGKTEERFNIAAARVTESGLPLVYLNQVGGQDELVFDGASFILNADCSLACQLTRRPSRSPCGRRARTAGCAGKRPWPRSRRAGRPITRPVSWACAIMWKRTAFPVWCWACPAASIPPSAPPWRWMPLAPIGFIA
jgi:NAD+ synthase